MNNDLISRSALRKRHSELCPGDCSSCDYNSATNGKLFCSLIDDAPAVDAEPVRHDNCQLCRIKETGHGVIAFYKVGWQACITRRDKGFFMVVGHEGDQIDIPIDFCPSCGAKMDAEVEG